MNSLRHKEYLLFLTKILLIFLVVGVFALIIRTPAHAYSSSCNTNGFPGVNSCTTVGQNCSCNCAIPTNATSHYVVGNEPTNCQTMDSYTRYGIDYVGSISGDPGCRVTRPYAYTINFCRNNVGFRAPQSGILILYTAFHNFRITVNGNTYSGNTNGTFTKFNTGLMVNAGDYVVPQFGYGSPGVYDAFGWRAYDNSSKYTADFQYARNDSAANGYTIFSEQIWGDADTPSIYDTMDFNDGRSAFALYNPTPTCADNNVSISVNPTSIYLSENGTFWINASNAAMFRFVSNTFSPNIHLRVPGGTTPCAPSAIGNRECTIFNRVTLNSGFNTNVNWTLNYRNCNGAFCSPVCSTQPFPFTIRPYPGYMLTQGGTAYLGGKLTQNKFPAGSYFATGIFSSYWPRASHYPPTFLGNRFNLMPYQDTNNDSSFFTRNSSKILTSTNIVQHNLGGGITFDSTMISNIANTSNKVHVFNINGNATFGLTAAGAANNQVYCNNSSIFIINGSATFNRPMKYRPGQDSACLFLVRDGVTINQFQNPDEFWGFIITNDFSTTDNFGKLTVKGGVVLQGAAGSEALNLGRNINNNVVDAPTVNANKTRPSIELQYEGARYIKHFGSILRNPFEISIREITYTKAQ